MTNSDKKYDAEADETKAKAEETAKKDKAEEQEKKKTGLFTKPIKPGGGGFRAIVRK